MRKRTRKFLCLLLSVILALGCIGCAKEKEADKKPAAWSLPPAVETTQPVETTAGEPVLPEAYQKILDEIIVESATPFEDGKYYYHFHFGQDLYYSLADLDGNGVDELLIGRPGDVMDIFTCRNGESVWLINRFVYGAPSTVTVMETGEWYITTFSAGEQGGRFMQRIGADGGSVDEVFGYLISFENIYQADNGSTLTEDEFQGLLAGYTPRDIRWTQFTGVTEATEKQYEEILDEYRAACNDRNYLEHPENYPHIRNVGMDYLHRYGLSGDVSYAIEDIDGNGVMELIVGCCGDIWDVYSHDGSRPVKLVDDEALGGGRSRIEIMNGGYLYHTGSSGADSSSCHMLKIAGDGVTTETAFYFNIISDGMGGCHYNGLIGNDAAILSEDEFDELLQKYEEAFIYWETLWEMPATAPEITGGNTPETSPVLSAHDAYARILDEYIADMFDMYDGNYDPNRYPHSKYIDPDALTWNPDGSETGFQLAYSYYDVNLDGVDELLIGYATENNGVIKTDYGFLPIIDFYTFDGTKAVQHFSDASLGVTAYMSIMSDGIHFTEGNDDQSYFACYEIADNGYSLEECYAYYTCMEDGMPVYYNETDRLTDMEFMAAHGIQVSVNDIEWTNFAGYATWN